MLGSREALFAFAQTVIDGSRAARHRRRSQSVLPDLRRRGAARRRADVWCVNADPAQAFAHDWRRRARTTSGRARSCSTSARPTTRPAACSTSPNGGTLFALSDRYGFVIASDECYSEIYFDEARPPLGALAAAQALGRDGYPRLVVFGSLSKRSNAPGLRSGYVAGDAALIKAFLLYRTYHGSAMSPAVAAASIAAWNDEAHVRRQPRRIRGQVRGAAAAARAGAAVRDARGRVLPVGANARSTTQRFARRLLAEENVAVLPGSYVARDAHGAQSRAGPRRLALVAPAAECAEAIDRIVAFARRLATRPWPAGGALRPAR